MIRKKTRHQVSWTQMAILLLSCPNPRNGPIIQRAAASTDESKARLLRQRIVGANDDSARSRRRRRPGEERTLQKASVSSNLLSKNEINQLSCNSNQQLFALNLQTDGFGKETSWSLRRHFANGRQYVGYGPPDGVQYGDLTIYSFQYCLERGETYVLSIEDNFGDGLCCDRGYGAYEFALGGTVVYSSDFQKTFNDYVEHTFTVGEVYTAMPTKRPTNEPTKQATASPVVLLENGEPTSLPTVRPTNTPSKSPTPVPSTSPTLAPTARPSRPPTSKPTPDDSVYNPKNGCYGGDVKVKVEVKADEFSNDTSWHIIDYYTGETLLKQKDHTFKQYEYKYKETCLPHGLYNFTIWDEYGDGICCRYGEGYFRVSLDGDPVLFGGSFNENVTEILNVGYDPTGVMTQREKDYLEAHNTRRKDWHERYNLTYVPLKYSPALAKTAQAWADELLHACGVVGIEHEDFNPYGENLAKNVGRNGWGQLYPANSIVGRWVEFEVGLPYPSNGHLTQVLWRASTYLGCGESAKEYRGGMCRVQVCRYGRAGNCDMQGFNATYGENWLVPMLKNYTRCGPNCPQEGCF
ncbi:hypothetical protein ACHAW6_003970 [Cyclotella cf. meneghiniana]